MVQIIAVLSSDAVTMRPDEPKETELTLLLCPVCVERRSPVFESHILRVSSSDTVARRLESALNETDLTLSVCPVSVLRRVPVVGSQILTVLSSDAVARIVESWLKATELTLALWPVRVKS